MVCVYVHVCMCYDMCLEARGKLQSQFYPSSFCVGLEFRLPFLHDKVHYMMSSLAGPLDFFFQCWGVNPGSCAWQAIHQLMYIPSSLLPYFMYLQVSLQVWQMCDFSFLIQCVVQSLLGRVQILYHLSKVLRLSEN